MPFRASLASGLLVAALSLVAAGCAPEILTMTRRAAATRAGAMQSWETQGELPKPCVGMSPGALAVGLHEGGRPEVLGLDENRSTGEVSPWRAVQCERRAGAMV